MESLFADLAEAGIPREDLFLAWDFTVGSAERITGRLLKMRDEAFAELGDTELDDLTVQGSAPTFAVTSTEERGDEPDLVKGHFTVPCHLNAPACPPGSRFAFTDAHGNEPARLPLNTMPANFECLVPDSATPANPARPSLYGHGLLGQAREVDLPLQRAMVQNHNFIYCATDWRACRPRTCRTSARSCSTCRTSRR